MSTKALLEYLVSQLVDNPDEVEVTEFESKKQDTILELRVAEADTGKVIGKGGRIAQALRTVVKAAALKNGERVSVEIV
ncbi:MAG TPA: KH domain-containing protein [Phycisphaerales bacterium]|nr:KH domain-containing protein [Phycisphaerales bacterium]